MGINRSSKLGVTKKERLGTKKRPAIFLDRDGTIIHQVDSLLKISQIKLFTNTASTIKAFNKLGYLVVIATNQPIIARGIIGPKELDAIHAVIVGRLAKKGAIIDAIYYCPHHPQATLKKYRINCSCRKPKPGMILKAAKDHSIDLKKSFFIGDSTQDVLAANRAKVTMILLRTGHGGKDPWQHPGTPDVIVNDLTEALRVIKKVTTQ